MRISSVIQLARQYMLVGIMGAVIAIGLFLIGYFIVYKKLMKGTNLHLFSSYKEAYNNFSLGEWRNIILNILMFVPIGFMMPLLIKKCERWYITYLVGFCITLFIETLQLISKRGIFEVDDIVNNTLGCVIGYGIVMIFLSLFKRKKVIQKHKALIITAYQIPLIVSIISISVIFINYNHHFQI